MSESDGSPAKPRTSARRALLVAGAALLSVCAFWGAASSAAYFVDEPFSYLGRPLYIQNMVYSFGRFLTPPESTLYVIAAVLLVPAVAVVALGSARIFRADPLAYVADRLGGSGRNVALLCAFVAVAGATFVTYGLLDRAELIDDERAYTFQAELFASFKSSLPKPPAALRNPMFIVEPVWTSIYPPGHALVLAVGAALGSVRIVPPLLAAGLVLAIWSFVRSAFGERQALLAATLAAISPFVWSVYGTLMAFGTSACAVAGFLAALAWSERPGKMKLAVLAGAAMGVVFVTRPFEAVAVGLPFAVTLTYAALRRKPGGPRRFLLVLAGFVAVAWLLPWNNHAVLGSPWRFTWLESQDAYELGFTKPMPHMDYVHTPGAAVGTLATALVRLELWLFAWPASLLVVAFALFTAKAPWERALRNAFLSYLACYALVFGSGVWDVGPGYYFACVPLLVPLFVRGLVRLREAAPAELGKAVSWLPIAGAVLGFVTVAPRHALSLIHLGREVRAPWEAIAESGIGDANVVIPNAQSRLAAGWSFGYPYSIPTGPNTEARLFQPVTRAEYEAAIAWLGERPVYTLVPHQDSLRRGWRGYEIVPFDPDRAFGNPASTGNAKR